MYFQEVQKRMNCLLTEGTKGRHRQLMIYTLREQQSEGLCTKKRFWKFRKCPVSLSGLWLARWNTELCTSRRSGGQYTHSNQSQPIHISVKLHRDLRRREAHADGFLGIREILLHTSVYDRISYVSPWRYGAGLEAFGYAISGHV